MLQGPGKGNATQGLLVGPTMGECSPALAQYIRMKTGSYSQTSRSVLS